MIYNGRPLNRQEIKRRALFTQEWKDEVSEDAEAKSFWDDIFNVFGIGRRRVATFELFQRVIECKNTPKPVMLLLQYIEQSSQPEQVVLIPSLVVVDQLEAAPY